MYLGFLRTPIPHNGQPMVIPVQESLFLLKPMLRQTLSLAGSFVIGLFFFYFIILPTLQPLEGLLVHTGFQFHILPWKRLLCQPLKLKPLGLSIANKHSKCSRDSSCMGGSLQFQFSWLPLFQISGMYPSFSELSGAFK